MALNLIINEDDLERTALALKSVNPGRSSAAHIRDMIRANIRPDENTYISTAGWVAFTWLDRVTLETHVKVAVCAYSVNKYLEEHPHHENA